jgi:hypothetical protein
MVHLPSSVLSSSVFMVEKRGSLGGNERAVAYHLSSCLELCLIVSKAQMKHIEVIYILCLLDFQSNLCVRLPARNEQTKREPFLEESKDLMQAIVCNGQTGRHLKFHRDLWT